MSILGSLFKRKSAFDHLTRGLASLGQDRWDAAYRELQSADSILTRSGNPQKAGLNSVDLLFLHVSLSIIDAAAGARDKALDRIALCFRTVQLTPRVRDFLGRLKKQTQSEETGTLKTPCSISGRTVSLELYVFKEVLISELLNGNHDAGPDLDFDTVRARVSDGFALGHREKSEE